jgi:DNA gyrase subunit A
VARNSERGLEADDVDAEDAENPTESPATAADDVTLAEGAGSHNGSADADSAPAAESEESSDNAELDEENTGGNE